MLCPSVPLGIPVPGTNREGGWPCLVLFANLLSAFPPRSDHRFDFGVRTAKAKSSLPCLLRPVTKSFEPVMNVTMHTNTHCKVFPSTWGNLHTGTPCPRTAGVLRFSIAQTLSLSLLRRIFILSVQTTESAVTAKTNGDVT